MAIKCRLFGHEAEWIKMPHSIYKGSPLDSSGVAKCSRCGREWSGAETLNLTIGWHTSGVNGIQHDFSTGQTTYWKA